ncbi:flagellar basal body L-ring protein FlgH [Pontiella agarivorans]|uniref:Flagellar basal body L-ring protein FlgH n=1 Tax=Pontiella agarivorans TaxID=3038953 RepID=A0ABU5MSX2_9BACT|nr:flagellar basal body L-ring protein FlgH [Pontiella agarivorans]MDZ8117299.1 flagellar basal body L-ring protein FlgH [Pontiella agarivorans]
MKRIIACVLCLATAAMAEEGGLAKRMYADRTARQVGDLVTVAIEEQSSVQKDASDDRSKSADGNMSFNFPGMEANGKAMWDALRLPEWSVGASKNYSASGGKASSDAFSASITVHITEKLPNGNLMIMGDRKVNIDGDIILFTLSGMIRPDDINRSNTVLSSRIAGAAITYETVGEFGKSQRKGLFSRTLDWIIPF